MWSPSATARRVIQMLAHGRDRKNDFEEVGRVGDPTSIESTMRAHRRCALLGVRVDSAKVPRRELLYQVQPLRCCLVEGLSFNTGAIKTIC